MQGSSGILVREGRTGVPRSKETAPPPLRSPQGPGHSPTVRSHGVAVFYERGWQRTISVGGASGPVEELARLQLHFQHLQHAQGRKPASPGRRPRVGRGDQRGDRHRLGACLGAWGSRQGRLGEAGLLDLDEWREGGSRVYTLHPVRLHGIHLVR